MSTERFMSKSNSAGFWNRIKTVLFNKSVTDIKISGKTVIITKGDGSKSEQTTQDTITTYGVVSKTADGLAPQLPNETSTTKYLRQDGTWAVPPDSDTTYNVFKGATATNKGEEGLVPEPERGKSKALLFGSGVWSDVILDLYNVTNGLEILLQANNTDIGTIDSVVIPLVSASNNGLMTTALFDKLNNLPTKKEIEETYADKASYLKKTDATLTYVSKTGLSTELATYAKKSDVINMYVYKGSVADVSKLPTTGQQVGWVYNIESASVYGGAGMNVAWNGTTWDPLGGIFTITEMTEEDLDEICV